MIIVTTDDQYRSILRVLAAEVFFRMIVIDSGDVTSPRAPDREGLFSREGRFTDTAAV
jgi:hypothetical protein